jgi:hypothetical protein
MNMGCVCCYMLSALFTVPTKQQCLLLTMFTVPAANFVYRAYWTTVPAANFVNSACCQLCAQFLLLSNCCYFVYRVYCILPAANFVYCTVPTAQCLCLQCLLPRDLLLIEFSRVYCCVHSKRRELCLHPIFDGTSAIFTELAVTVLLS